MRGGDPERFLVPAQEHHIDQFVEVKGKVLAWISFDEGFVL
jgi:hypothetical protein